MKRLILTFGLLAVLLAGCAPDPRRQADADATRMQAEQLAANQEQVREQDAQEHDLKMQDRRATQAAWQAALNKMIRSFMIFGQVTIALWLLSLGVTGVWMMYGTTRAYNRWVEVRANLIHLDPRTGTYPALIQYIGQGRYSLTYPDNSVLMLDTRNEHDRAKVIAMANIQHSYTLAHQARLSHKPGEIAQIPAAQIIDMESER